MNKLLILALIPLVALAGPTENMQAQCKVVMDAGVCRVALDPKDYPNPTILIAGVGRISTASYLKIRNTGEAKDANGEWTMCTTVSKICTSSWESDECKAARSLFSQQSPNVRPPGSNDSSTIRR